MSTATVSTLPGHGFHVMSKPIGPICNLDCKYCFYLEKEKLYSDERKWKMSDEVLELQSKYAGEKKISNALQTNGTLLDDEWCEFLRQHGFLVGLSIDGPRDLHDKYRV